MWEDGEFLFIGLSGLFLTVLFPALITYASTGFIVLSREPTPSWFWRRT